MCIWNRFCSYSFIFHPYHLTLSHLKLSSHFPAKTKPSQSYVIIFLILARGRFRKKLRNEASVQRSSSSTPSNPPFERSLCWGSAWGKNGKQVSCYAYLYFQGKPVTQFVSNIITTIWRKFHRLLMGYSSSISVFILLMIWIRHN